MAAIRRMSATHAGVELERAAAGGGFRIPEHHADLLADLVDEDQAGIGFRNDAGELAHGLRHQARVHAHEAIAHLAVELGLGHQGRHRIDHQNVDRPGGDQRVGDLQRLLAVIGLRDQQVVDIHAELAGVDRIERVLDIDVGSHAAGFLRLRDHLQREGRFPGRFRAEDFRDAPARKSADAQRRIHRDRSRGNGGDGLHGLRAQANHGAFAELLLDLAQGRTQGTRAFFFVHGRVLAIFGGTLIIARRLKQIVPVIVARRNPWKPAAHG